MNQQKAETDMNTHKGKVNEYVEHATTVAEAVNRGSEPLRDVAGMARKTVITVSIIAVVGVLVLAAMIIGAVKA